MRSCLLARPCPTRRPPAAHSTEAGPSGPCPQDVVANTDTPPTYKASRQGGVARLLRTEVPIVSQKNHLGTPALPQAAAHNQDAACEPLRQDRIGLAVLYSNYGRSSRAGNRNSARFVLHACKCDDTLRPAHEARGRNRAVEYANLGRSGLPVSAVGLGCNNFGRRCDQEQTKAVGEKALEMGVTFFDTADIY